MVMLKSLLICFILFLGVSAVSYEECTCSLGDEDQSCVPDGHLIELLSFNSASGYADYSVCSEYPGGGGSQTISSFNFVYDDSPACVETSTYSATGCTNEYAYADRNDAASNSFDTCTQTSCSLESGDSSCGLSGISGVANIKCNYGISAGMCVTVRVFFPAGMSQGSMGTLVNTASGCQQGCILGPSCDACTVPSPSPSRDLEAACTALDQGVLPYCTGLDLADPGCDVARREEHRLDGLNVKNSRELKDTSSHHAATFSEAEFKTLDYFNPEYQGGAFQNGLTKSVSIPLTNGVARADCPVTTTHIRVRLDGLSKGQTIWVAGDGGEENSEQHGAVKGPFESKKILRAGGYTPSVEGSGMVVAVENKDLDKIFVKEIVCIFTNGKKTQNAHLTQRAARDASEKTVDSKEEVLIGSSSGFDASGFGSSSSVDETSSKSARGYTPPSDCYCAEGLNEEPCAEFCSGTLDCTVGMGCVKDSILPFSRDVPELGVALISFMKGGVPRICSGGLLAQVLGHPPGEACDATNDCETNLYNNFDSTNFLTSSECITSQTEAASADFYFDYGVSCDEGISSSCSSTSCAFLSSGADYVMSSEDDLFDFIDDIGVGGWSPLGSFSLIKLTGTLPAKRCYFGYARKNYWGEEVGSTIYRVSHPEGAPRAYAEAVIAEPSFWSDPLDDDAEDIRGTYFPSRHTEIQGIGLSALGPQSGSVGGIVFNKNGQVVGTQAGFTAEGTDYCDPADYVVVDGHFDSYYNQISSQLEELCCPTVGGITKLDFNFETDGSRIEPPTTDPASGDLGDTVRYRWSDWGVTVDTLDSGHPPQLFNTAVPPGDTDLGTPNQAFGGPGIGKSNIANDKGSSGPGANYRSHGWVMIISENNDINRPDDNGRGGTLVFTFNQSVRVDYMEFIDIDFDETDGLITLFDDQGVERTKNILAFGNNAYYRADLYLQNIVKITVYFRSSGCVGSIVFCDDTVASQNTIGDRVWLDANNNGIQEAYETVGVPGVIVQLHFNDFGIEEDDRIEETTTDENGYYLFSSLPDGDYRVSFTVPDDLDFFDQFESNSDYNGWTFSPFLQGDDTAKDSDAEEVEVEAGHDRRAVTGIISVADGTFDLTWDAGIYIDSQYVCVPEPAPTRRSKKNVAPKQRTDEQKTNRN